jgi:hypothetical protein
VRSSRLRPRSRCRCRRPGSASHGAPTKSGPRREKAVRHRWVRAFLVPHPDGPFLATTLSPCIWLRTLAKPYPEVPTRRTTSAQASHPRRRRRPGRPTSG